MTKQWTVTLMKTTTWTAVVEVRAETEDEAMDKGILQAEQAATKEQVDWDLDDESIEVTEALED